MKILLLLLLASAASLRAAAEKPNIILIIADDLGYGDIGCYGSERNPTPHLDALASEGMRFTDFHSNGAICSPTRAALMTGRYQQRVGIGGVVSAARHRDTGIAVTETTIADSFSKNGYATALFGKWHLGYAPRFNPIYQGFDQFTGFVSGNVDFFSHIDQEGHIDWWQGDQLKPEQGYVTHLVTDHGLRFIEANKDRPFFLVLAHLSPHYPYQSPNDKAFRQPGKRKPRRLTSNIAPIYAEMIAEMDKGIGQIIASLKKNDLSERTLVIFCSDNGANKEGSNGSLRGQKGSIWEGGHRVPMITRWPGMIPAGKVSDAIVLTMDFFPTFSEIAGITPPENLDGLSILPTFKDGVAPPERTVFWSVGNHLAARRGPWKLVIEGKDTSGKSSLYHLGNDPAESTPVTHSEIQEQLKSELNTWLQTWANVPQKS